MADGPSARAVRRPWCSSNPVVPLAQGEAHFRADAELRGKWVLKGEPALVDSTSPRRGEAVREYLRTSGFGIRLVNLPGYSPDFNADEAIWGWVREEATGNLCLGTKALVQERVSNFLAELAFRKDEVKRRCRTVLQSRAEELLRRSPTDSRLSANVHPTLALV